MTFALRELSQLESSDVFEQSRFGHLACSKDNQPYVVPIYFAYEGGIAYSFAMPGQKIDWMRGNDKVCLQVEKHSPSNSWTSVVAQGRYEEFPDTDQWKQERLHAWSLLQRFSDWWEIGALKPHEMPVQNASPHVFFGIVLKDISGRMVVSD